MLLKLSSYFDVCTHASFAFSKTEKLWFKRCEVFERWPFKKSPERNLFLKISFEEYFQETLRDRDPEARSQPS